jgi:hypothetical protein
VRLAAPHRAISPVNPAHLVVLAAALAVPVAGHAALYKCAVDGGTVVYQDTPCPAGRELRDFDRDPGNVSVVPFGNAPAPSPPRSGARAAPKADAKVNAKAIAKSDSKPAKADARTRRPPADPQQRRFLHAGMSEGEVIARVGQPDVKTKTRRGVRWTYLPVADDAGTMTTVTFERGAVAEIERKIIR